MDNNMIRRLLGRSRQRPAQQPDRPPQSRRSAPANAQPSADGVDAPGRSPASAPPSPRSAVASVPPSSVPAPPAPTSVQGSPTRQAASHRTSAASQDAIPNQRVASSVESEATAMHFLGHLFLAQALGNLSPDMVLGERQVTLRRTASGGFVIEEDAFITIAAGMDDDMDEAMQRIQEDDERAFQENFSLAHQGSVGAMRQTIDALWARPQAEVPAAGITQAHIAERDWQIMYKLPALMLARQLPKLCAGRGVLSHIALFDEPWQKQRPQSNEAYASLLPKIYEHLMSMHEHDTQALDAALPALVERVSRLLETGHADATPAEKQLAQLIRDAVHHIDGQVLYETLGQAYKHLPSA